MRLDRARIGLALLVLSGLAQLRAAAQESETTYIVIPPQTSEVSKHSEVPAAQMIETHPIQRGIRLASWPLGGQGRLHDKLNQCGYCCKSHIDWYGCNTWRTQCQFVFGSCKSFFGETCLPPETRGLGQMHNGQGCSQCGR